MALTSLGDEAQRAFHGSQPGIDIERSGFTAAAVELAESEGMLLVNLQRLYGDLRVDLLAEG